jgi:hypothetical protein
MAANELDTAAPGAATSDLNSSTRSSFCRKEKTGALSATDILDYLITRTLAYLLLNCEDGGNKAKLDGCH